MSDLEGRAKPILENFIADPIRLPSLTEDERQIRRLRFAHAWAKPEAEVLEQLMSSLHSGPVGLRTFFVGGHVH